MGHDRPDRPTLGLSPATPVRDEQRRSGDSGIRSLFTPKAVILALLTVAGMGLSVGRWQGASEHNDSELAADIARVEAKANAAQAASATDALDKRYVPREVYQADIAWIKQTLTEIRDYQKDRRPPK
jgi:hypothetical protein